MRGVLYFSKQAYLQFSFGAW